mmetsp:Transcript_145497/g.362805  ORF Transcript_145497/g.362805 Transcript_145497/m.362805 type:complete len:281 (-) Transcript_145497:163-1005(-)
MTNSALDGMHARVSVSPAMLHVLPVLRGEGREGRHGEVAIQRAIVEIFWLVEDVSEAAMGYVGLLIACANVLSRAQPDKVLRSGLHHVAQCNRVEAAPVQGLCPLAPPHLLFEIHGLCCRVLRKSECLHRKKFLISVEIHPTANRKQAFHSQVVVGMGVQVQVQARVSARVAPTILSGLLGYTQLLPAVLSDRHLDHLSHVQKDIARKRRNAGLIQQLVARYDPFAAVCAWVSVQAYHIGDAGQLDWTKFFWELIGQEAEKTKELPERHVPFAPPPDEFP